MGRSGLGPEGVPAVHETFVGDGKVPQPHEIGLISRQRQGLVRCQSLSTEAVRGLGQVVGYAGDSMPEPVSGVHGLGSPSGPHGLRPADPAGILEVHRILSGSGVPTILLDPGTGGAPVLCLCLHLASRGAARLAATVVPPRCGDDISLGCRCV